MSRREFNAELYAGRWHEIGKFPFAYEPENCVKVYADYTYNKESKAIYLQNFCSGPDYLDYADGLLWNTEANLGTGNFEAQFFRFNSTPGEYIVINTDYVSYSLVGDRSGNLFWILSRTPKIEKRQLNALLRKAQGYGYNIDLLEISADSIN